MLFLIVIAIIFAFVLLVFILRRGRESEFTEAYWRKKTRGKLARRDGEKCSNCGREDYLEIDHILPKSRGGTDDLSNLQLLCTECNMSKGSRTMEEWDRKPLVMAEYNIKAIWAWRKHRIRAKDLPESIKRNLQYDLAKYGYTTEEIRKMMKPPRGISRKDHHKDLQELLEKRIAWEKNMKQWNKFLGH